MRKEKDIELKCKICNVEYEKTQQLTTHIQRGHNMTLKDYYDQYMKQPGEGICLRCGKPTAWLNKLRLGYNHYCSNVCSSSVRKNAVKTKKTIESSIVQKSISAVKVINEHNIKLENSNIVSKVKEIVPVNESDKNIENNSNINYVQRMQDINEAKMIQKYDSCFLLNGYNLIGYKNNEFIAKCNVCNKEFRIGPQALQERIHDGEILCTICNNKSGGAVKKLENIIEFIKGLGFNLLTNVKDVVKDKELDIYIPEKKLAIEFDDLVMHNELHISNKCHVEKTNACEAVGIQLIHIYEDEWDFKQEVVKSRLKGLLGLNERIYARKCEFREVDFHVAKSFLEQNHIQGACVSKYNYALYQGERILAIMTFGKSRFSDEFELLRYCSAQNVNVIGGAGKLFNIFMKNHPEIDEITSFADRRWSIGNLYAQLGFKKVDVTQCAYFYVVGDHRENRIKYQKHKLITRDGADPNSTEHQIMLDRQIYRIYDCGNLKYVYYRNKEQE